MNAADYKELINAARNCVDIKLGCRSRNCNCPYEGVSVVNDFCMNQLVDDLVKAIERLIRERDAAVAELESLQACEDCKWYNESTHNCEDVEHEVCTAFESHWEWRGVQEGAGCD